MTSPKSLLFLLLAPAAITAQVTTGALTVTVLDDAGNPLPGAKIVLESPALFQPRTMTTDANGVARFVLLPVGNYNGTFSAAGFLPRKAMDVRIGVGSNLSLPVSLRRMPN
jgi:hypothetical protein